MRTLYVALAFQTPPSSPTSYPSYTDTRGFDVTGVITEVDLTFPLVKNECDCIQQCLDRPTTCANYVWKFATADGVKTGHRSCTLYSDFNLPSEVTVVLNVNDPRNRNVNAAAIQTNNNNPHMGALVPQAFKDINLSQQPDPHAVSGYVKSPCKRGLSC